MAVASYKVCPKYVPNYYLIVYIYLYISLALLSSRGLPSHLLGALRPHVQQLIQKTVGSGSYTLPYFTFYLLLTKLVGYLK